MIKSEEEEELEQKGEKEEEEFTIDAKNPAPLEGFITLDNSKDELKEYRRSGNTYKSSGSSMQTSSDGPRRSEMNKRGIYVLQDFESHRTEFYDLSSFEIAPVIRFHSGNGWVGTCGFVDENIAVCATTEGMIYKYNITNNYEQMKIADNNPSGNGFHTLTITKDKNIITAYYECIYIYTSSGNYINKSCSSQRAKDMLQMQEVRTNTIVTAEKYSVNSHDIRNPRNTIVYKLLEKANTNTEYRSIVGLEGMRGDLALGGRIYTSGTYYGYVELFHLDENNASLHPIPNKRWVGPHTLRIDIIREIQVGVLIFGGENECADICTWGYAVIPHASPACYPIGGSWIWDIIPLP